MIRHLWWLGLRCRPDLSGLATTRLSLVCRDIYLGPLKPEAFPALFEARQPISPAQIETGSMAWRAFCAADPRALAGLATATATDYTEYTEYAELPCLRAALVRHLEEYPSTANGLSRTESQMLRVLLDGPLTFAAAFRASTDLEERMFMGDLSFRRLANTLASAPHPLLTLDPLSITPVGRDVLAGRADHVTLNGIDRWLGGVHLTPANCYRWDGRALLRA